MSEELPSQPTDEIFGIPLRVPEAPAPEELILPEPPSPIEELRSADAAPPEPSGVSSGEAADPDDETVPGGPAPAVAAVPDEGAGTTEAGGTRELPGAPGDYEALERRISAMEARLDRLLAALRGAAGEPVRSPDTPVVPSPGESEDPGI